MPSVLRGIPFPYRTLDGVPRPILTVRLTNTANGRSAMFEGLVDTGAPLCCAPDWVGAAIGHSVTEGREKFPLAIAGYRCDAYRHDQSRIEILYVDKAGHRAFLSPVDCPFYFCVPVTPEPVRPTWGGPFIVLGADPVMRHYRFLFDFERRMFYIAY